MGKKKLYEYEVMLPAHEYWVFDVIAESEAQAIKMASSGEYYQTCTFACGKDAKVKCTRGRALFIKEGEK